jgi:FixJ family two-component response regulator
VSTAPLVHVVDDDPDIRISLQLLLSSVAIDAITYASADEFLLRFREMPGRPAVLLLDVRLPGLSGMALLERLRAERSPLPVIMLTGHGDIDMAVRAMKVGATDFLTKPFSSQILLDRIQDVLRRSSDLVAPAVGFDESVSVARFATLTAREREIFDHIVSGDSNKAVARKLGISIRTVESHRASIMEKMEAKTLVDLVLASVHLKKARD